MTPYERGYAAALKAAAGVVATNKIGDELAYGSVTQAWLERAILSLPIQGETQPTHPSAKPFKCPHCGSHYFGPTFRGKEIAGRYCKGWPSGYDRSYNPCPAKHVEWYEQADQRGTAALQEVQRQAPGQTREEQPGTAGRGVGIGGGVAPAVTAQSDPKAPVSQSVPHHNPGEQVVRDAHTEDGSKHCVEPARPGPSQECVIVPVEELKIVLDFFRKANWPDTRAGNAAYRLNSAMLAAAKEE